MLSVLRSHDLRFPGEPLRRRFDQCDWIRLCTEAISWKCKGSFCSRHWFFGAHLIIDGEAKPESLMGLVKDTLKANPNNSVIGFKDNSSAIRYESFRHPSLFYTLLKDREAHSAGGNTDPVTLAFTSCWRL